uniref:Cytochrome b n=1 Tax=Cephalodiscus hodgsoni TaxID=560606 RepID=A0A481P881_9BILA|nr:cytochrome b [Cephalodiscus hodgsoni]
MFGRRKELVLGVLGEGFVDFRSPINLSWLWTFGSCLGVGLIIQVMSGLFLACHYVPSLECAFSSVSHIERDVSYGWLLRGVHANGASLFFVCLYLHVGRGWYYSSWLQGFKVWYTGYSLLLLSMAVAFLGYVLPWGNMSYWAAMVITNLFSAVPFVGGGLVGWLWGGFCVGDATLKRFFVGHFFFPFIMLGVAFLHIVYLHEKGSSNSVTGGWSMWNSSFHGLYTWKDLVGFIFYFLCVLFISFLVPYVFMDSSNFYLADPLSTPTHIQPEWYFLFPYAVLRAVPSKGLGVLAFVLAIGLFGVLPYLGGSGDIYGVWSPKYQVWMGLLWGWFGCLVFLGACPAEFPYVTFSRLVCCEVLVGIGWGLYINSFVKLVD